MPYDQEWIREFRWYIQSRLERLEQYKAEIEGQLYRDRRSLIQRSSKGTRSPSDPTVGRRLFHLEYVISNTFRYSMLIALCTFLEEAVQTIAQQIVRDADGIAKRIKGKSVLGKYLKVLEERAGVDLTPVSRDIQVLAHLVVLRNCVAHAWGKLGRTRNRCAVEKAVKQVATAAISRDGFLILSDQVIPQAIVAAETIAEHILDMLASADSVP